MAAADSEEYGRFLADQIKSCYQMVVTREDMVPYCTEKFGFSEIFKCRKVARFSKEKVSLKTDLRIVHADDVRLAQIKSFYHTIPPEEIDEISRRGNLFCAFSGREFVGFCGNHLDGSLGLLDIFPEYQRRGYGEQLERFMINEMLDRGEIPYGEVVLGNTASVRLQEKLGFDISQEIITWLL